MRTILMKALSITAAVTAAVIAVPASAQVTYVYDTISVPGQPGSFLSGITDNGEAILNGNSSPLVPSGQYIYSPATGLVGLPNPSGIYNGNVAAYGINDAGVVVGAACNCTASNPAGTLQQGFILQNGSYSYFSYPGASDTVARAISSNGIVTGYDNVSGGFQYNPATGVFTAIYPPNSVSPSVSYLQSLAASSFTPAQGITASGQIVGSTLLSANNPAGSSNPFFSGYLYTPTSNSYNVFQVDGDSTQARGINAGGTITGFVSVAGSTDAFVGTPGSFQLLSAPSATATFGEAINNSGQVAGIYFDSSGNNHGFIATPADMPSSVHGNTYSFNVLGVGSGSVTYLGPMVASGYQFTIGAGNPDFASVVLPLDFDATNSYILSACNGGGVLGTVAGGQTFSFGSGGVACFDVSGVTGVTGSNASAFVTGLTFEGAGNFTGTAVRVPEPASLTLFALACAGLGCLRRRRAG